MKDRVYRYAALGFVFLFSCLYSNWLLGGNIELLIDKLNNSKIEALIISIASAPLFGFMISTLTPAEWIRKRIRAQPKNKPSQAYLELIYSKFTNSGINESGIVLEGNTFIVKESEKLNMAHQALFRDDVSEEVLGYTLRRNDVFFIQLNSVCAILIGFFWGGGYELLHSDLSKKETDLLKAWPLLFISFYCFAAIYHAITEVNRAQKFEEVYVFKKYKP